MSNQGKPQKDRKIKGKDNKTVIFDVVYLGQCGCGYKSKLSRRIELKETQTLVDLHEVIQEAIGWDDPHLYSFFMDGKAWSKDKSKEYTCPEQDMDYVVDMIGYKPKTADIRVKSLKLRPRRKFLYLFDFGDNHQFSVKVVGFGEAKGGEKYPKLIQARGKAPPQYPDTEG